MTDQSKLTLTPAEALEGQSPLVITADLEPIAGLDRFQPAGFPEIGHVIYKAPKADGSEESVCIVDSAASMANHLESLCMRGAHDYELVEDLAGMPYLRCVTGDIKDGKLPLDKREVVATSLTEGHRIASNYFFGTRKNRKWDGKSAQRVMRNDLICEKSFGDELAESDNFCILSDGEKIAHAPPEKWWNVFKTIFKFDPNALVHGVLFTEWQIKISRFLTAHLEAFGAGRVDRSGVKFDRLGKTTSGQPIFAVDDAVAQQIRATFILDISLVRSFGRADNGVSRGLNSKQKEFLIALALWKIQRLVNTPFRYRSGCHLALRNNGLKVNGTPAVIEVNIGEAIQNADFGEPSSRITDIYWPREELYREGKDENQATSGDASADQDDDSGDGEG